MQSFEVDYSFLQTTSLSLSSNSIQFYFSLYLPNLQSFKTGRESFFETTSLSLSSNSIQFYFSLYLPQLNQISLGHNSFGETTSISLQSTLAFSFLYYLDVPFNNGNYSVAPLRHFEEENETFRKITSSSIISDESIRSFIHIIQ